MIDYAKRHYAYREQYVVGDARSLPFHDRQFDYSAAITSLCFIEEQERAIAEMVRVTRRRIALGLLNRYSLLYWQKGRHGGRGAYQWGKGKAVDLAKAVKTALDAQGAVAR